MIIYNAHKNRNVNILHYYLVDDLYKILSAYTYICTYTYTYLIFKCIHIEEEEDRDDIINWRYDSVSRCYASGT